GASSDKLAASSRRGKSDASAIILFSGALLRSVRERLQDKEVSSRSAAEPPSGHLEAAAGIRAADGLRVHESEEPLGGPALPGDLRCFTDQVRTQVGAFVAKQSAEDAALRILPEPLTLPDEHGVAVGRNEDGLLPRTDKQAASRLRVGAAIVAAEERI